MRNEELISELSRVNEQLKKLRNFPPNELQLAWYRKYEEIKLSQQVYTLTHEEKEELTEVINQWNLRRKNRQIPLLKETQRELLILVRDAITDELTRPEAMREEYKPKPKFKVGDTIVCVCPGRYYRRTKRVTNIKWSASTNTWLYDCSDSGYTVTNYDCWELVKEK